MGEESKSKGREEQKGRELLKLSSGRSAGKMKLQPVRVV